MRNHIPLPTRWRLLRPVLITIIIIFLILSYFFLKSRPNSELYKSLFLQEIEESRGSVRNTRDTRYVLFRQLQGAGFNNQAQEILLYHHLALEASRTYLYQPLVWRPRGKNALIPLSAFLAGVTKNSVSVAVFQEVCSPEYTKHVQIALNHAAWENAKQILGGQEKCVIVDDWILGWDFLASPALHDIWPTFQNYLENYFKWSEQIQAIADRAHSELRLRSQPSHTDGDPYLAMHLRRGDFENHCFGLVASHTGFTTWATLPMLQPSVFPPSLNTTNESSVIDHCFPSFDRILATIDSQLRAKPHLRTMHILHDGAWDHPLVYAQYYRIERALMSTERAKSAGWEGGPMTRVTHSGMVPIRWGEADWAVSVDVELARRAEVFIGNGYSSLSTQVIALRLGADRGRVEDITLF